MVVTGKIHLCTTFLGMDHYIIDEGLEGREVRGGRGGEGGEGRGEAVEDKQKKVIPMLCQRLVH